MSFFSIKLTTMDFSTPLIRSNLIQIYATLVQAEDIRGRAQYTSCKRGGVAQDFENPLRFHPMRPQNLTKQHGKKPDKTIMFHKYYTHDQQFSFSLPEAALLARIFSAKMPVRCKHDVYALLLATPSIGISIPPFLE